MPFHRHPGGFVMYSKISRSALAFYVGLMILNYASWNIVSGEKTYVNYIEKLFALKNHGNVCSTPECIHAASEIMKYMDPKVDPCKDFYRFACGGFLNSTAMPVDTPRIDAIEIITKKVREQLKVIFEEEINPNEPKSLGLVKTAYKACTNKFYIKENGVKSLKKELERLGGWPVLVGDSWNDDNFDWKKSIYEFWPNNDFITLKVKPNPRDMQKNIITIDYPNSDITSSDMLKGFANHKIVTYLRYMVDVALALGADETFANHELRQSLEFEIQLSNISLWYDVYHNRPSRYNLTSIAQLTRNYPSIDWKKTINEIFSPITSIDDNEIINFEISRYLSELEELMNRTPKRIQANYLMWRIIKRSMNYVNEDFQKIKTLIDNAIATGYSVKPTDESTDCFSQILHFLPNTVYVIYIKKYFNEDTRNKVIEMISPMKEELKKKFEKVEWYDDSTKERVLKAHAAMSFLIGYDDELMIANELEKIYANVEFPEKRYYEIYLKMSKLLAQYSVSNLRNPVKRMYGGVGISPIEANMEYKLNNTVYIPAGILQGVFFDNARPKYMTYSTLGSIVGQTMLHAFDVQSIRLNVAPRVKQHFRYKMECFIKQYDNYTIIQDGTVYHLNGDNSMFENMADTEGLKLAYYVYKNWTERNGEEKKLPGIDMTPRQLFWMSFANSWCTKYGPEELPLGDFAPYVASEFRVLGSLSNRPEFAEDFMCPKDSEMNPKNKCSIW